MSCVVWVVAMHGDGGQVGASVAAERMRSVDVNGGTARELGPSLGRHTASRARETQCASSRWQRQHRNGRRVSRRCGEQRRASYTSGAGCHVSGLALVGPCAGPNSARRNFFLAYLDCALHLNNTTPSPITRPPNRTANYGC
jgi:hypothetical protein